VELCEKTWSTHPVTIHQRPENNKVGMQFMQKWLRKTPYNLCRSCRGYCTLQFSLLPLGPLQFKNLEKRRGKQRYIKTFFS
jgi:hypothetical protein